MTARAAVPVPEIGSLLGRLATCAPRGPAAFPLDDIRYALLGGLYARAGLARREMAAGRVDTARHHLSRDAWLAVWHEATGTVTQRCLDEIDRRFAAADGESRLPQRVLERRTPSEADRMVIRSRIESAGIPLERSGLPEAAADWQDGLLRTAMALDESWERLERVAVAELAAWDADVAAVRAWRRPAGLLWLLSAGTAALALAIGLSLGGYLPAPGPLGTLQRWFWSLPWP